VTFWRALLSPQSVRYVARIRITADGKRRHARANENADLFWALRGGGGNFGIVTGLELRLHPGARVLGGLIAFRSGPGPFLRFYRDFMKAAPDALVMETSIVVADQPVILMYPMLERRTDRGRARARAPSGLRPSRCGRDRIRQLCAPDRSAGH
jgi:hypothetical protein